MDLRRLASAGTVAGAKNRVQRILLDPSPVGVTLFRAPLADGVVWESSYQCLEPQPGVDRVLWVRTSNIVLRKELPSGVPAVWSLQNFGGVVVQKLRGAVAQ